ncbi:hypothetical protein CVT24_003387 [Panaeolus cyanescens]|uniref:DUF1690 domain-containing protein n=1 Tax=Panaeolus cyanescens TaxID=181874 RepID=A0A409Y7E6_9AGAR|nr:hypothetical protein CVT24_003387 [Panaeolus cyanescens]
MGAGQSRSSPSDEKIFHNETPISFSPDVVNTLADRLDSSEPTQERQSVLDAHIRSRIKDELEVLKRNEEEIRQEIQVALEKENLDKEKQLAASDDGNSASSVTLLQDLEDIRTKIEKHESKKQLSEHPEIDTTAKALAECYQRNKTTPLICWSEVNKFKAAVAQLERQHLQTIP